jgi:LuxR family maltose regulon positive regulatory protein
MLRQAELVAQESSASFATTMLAYYRLWVWTSQGNLQAAMQLIQEHASEWGDKHSRTYALLTRAVARTFIAQGQAESDPALIRRALESLQEVLPQSEVMGLDGDVIVNLSLQALAYQALRQMRQATLALSRALALAEPEGYIRLFVDFGKPMAQLLLRAAESEPGLRLYAGELLAHFGVTSLAEKLVEPITERELDVLQRVASGSTDQEIAQQLVLSKATVKTHLRNIYGKLQVKNRTQAIARARVLRLLP